MATKPIPANDQSDAVAWGPRPVEDISDAPAVLPVNVTTIYAGPPEYVENFDLIDELRFASGLMTLIFVLANALEHFGLTAGEPRETYIAFGCVISAMVYISCQIIDTLRRVRF